jgi:tRNA(Arg) A34 adenosine deaminase TadA
MWDELSAPWQACLELVWEAYCDDCYPIGAVITSPEGVILSHGRNRVYPGWLWKGHSIGVDIAHAEVDALQHLDYFGIDPHTCILYASMEPCAMCMGAFYMSGLRTLHYATRDPYAGCVDMLGKTWYLDYKPIIVNGPIDGLETILMGLVIEQDCVRHAGELPDDIFYQRYRQGVPKGVEFGATLYRSRTVQVFRQERASANRVFERLAALVQ